MSQVLHIDLSKGGSRQVPHSWRLGVWAWRVEKGRHELVLGMGSESGGQVRQAYLVLTVVPVKFSLVKLSFVLYLFFSDTDTH